MNNTFLMCYMVDSTLTECQVVMYLIGNKITITRKQAELISMVDRMWKLSFSDMSLEEYSKTINTLIYSEVVAVPEIPTNKDVVDSACSCAVKHKGIVGLLIANKILHNERVGELTLHPEDIGLLKTLDDTGKYDLYKSRVRYGAFSSGS